MKRCHFAGTSLHVILFILFALSFLFPQHLFAQQHLAVNGYGPASYAAESTGKFMRQWLVAGPVAISTDSAGPNEALQEKVFTEDVLPLIVVTPDKPVVALHIKQQDLPWQLIASGEDIINLDTFYKGKDFVYAYALAEINVPAETNVMLAVGSDDGIKVWHNGKLVHENWVPRGINKDDDVVPLKLVKGSNQIVLKVQDIQGGWAFSARLLDKTGLSAKLATAAGNGNLDQITDLLQGGVDVNTKNERGISPIVAAKLAGREEAIQLLLKNGSKDEPVPAADVVVDAFYATLKNKMAPGIAILVARDGKVLYRKGFGYADIKNKIPVTPDTKFRIGSVTKQFTSAAILRLQENNQLSVNDPLSKYIPDFPSGNEVTVHQLLTHTSGIHSYTNKPDFITKVTHTISEDSLIQSFKNDPYDFNPGEKFLYNNSGYFLLGYIIGKVSKEPYGAYLKQTFFDPLHMNNTGLHFAGIKLEHEAKGYQGTDSYEEAINWDMSWAGAAGALYSTVDDLLKWNQALYGGKVLSSESFKKATTPVVLKNGEKASPEYGYGLGISNYRGQDIIAHGGGLNGFLTQLAYYPEEKLTVVMFTNTSSPEVNFDPNKIAEAFLWNKMDKQSSYSSAAVPAQNLEDFTGRFDFVNGAVMTFTTENNKLFAQLTGQSKFEVFPSAENEFFWKVVEARIKFIRNDSGEVTQALFSQNGQQITVKKLQEEKIINIDPLLLDQYVGRYKYSDSMVVSVTKENNRLFVQATGQPKFEMLPVSETDFVIKELNVRFSFIKENGKVNKAKLNMGGMNNELPRIE